MSTKEFINFSDFKNRIRDSLAATLSQDGFVFSKSKFSFRKKLNNNIIEVALDFLNKAPESYAYNFCVIIWIKEIQNITKDFFEFASLNEPARWTTVKFEGDFVDSLKTMEPKFRMAHYNKIYSLDEITECTNKTTTLISNQALPWAYSVCDLASFQDYYLSNKHEIVNHFTSVELFISSLLAAYMKSENDFKQLAGFLESELNIKKKEGKVYTQLYNYLASIRNFAAQTG